MVHCVSVPECLFHLNKQCTPSILSGSALFASVSACADPEGEQGVRIPHPLKNHKNIGFLSNYGPDPLKITKLPSHHAFRWRADDGPLIVVFGSSLPS